MSCPRCFLWCSAMVRTASSSQSLSRTQHSPSVNEDVVLDDGTEAVLYLSKYLMKKN